MASMEIHRWIQFDRSSVQAGMRLEHVRHFAKVKAAPEMISIINRNHRGAGYCASGP